MARERVLSHAEARTAYDRIGSWVDLQSLFEDAATADLEAHLDLGTVAALLEFGHGTGRFAEHLLSGRLPATATYTGVDLSPRMHALGERRLARFGARARVLLTDGSVPLPFDTGTFDRVVSNYVLDLLSLADIEAVLREAHRLLRPGGRLGLVGLTNGFTAATRAFERAWTFLHARRPALVGGCRPLALQPLLAPESWRVLYHRRLARFGVPSEILVAEKS